MRIVVVSAAFPPMAAGEADHTLHLCTHLADSGAEVHLLTTANHAGTNSLFKVHPVMRDWSWQDFPRLARFIKQHSPDAILLVYTSWIYNYHPLITFAPTIAKFLRRGVRVVTQFDSLGDVPYTPSLAARAAHLTMTFLAGLKDVDHYYGTLLRDSDKIIVLTDDYRAVLTDHFPGVSAKTVLIPPPPVLHMSQQPGASRQKVRAALDLKLDDFLLAFFGYIMPKKGLETLFRTMLILSQKRSDVRLVIIGGIKRDFPSTPSYADDILNMPSALGIADRVIWKTNFPADTDEASAYLNAADISVLPFDDGAVMNRSSIAAAAAHGLPIITTTRENLESAFKDQTNVLLCPPRNPKDLANAIELLIDNSKIRQRLGAGALQLASDWFSWDKAVQRTLETLQGP